MDFMSFKSFTNFIASVISGSRAKTSVVLVTSLYLDRCRRFFDAKAFGEHLLKERLFVAAIMLAYKVSKRISTSGVSGC